MATIASIFLLLLAAYLALGLLFAIPFLWVGIKKVDHSAANPSFALRLILLPGTIAFWPILLTKWIKAN